MKTFPELFEKLYGPNPYYDESQVQRVLQCIDTEKIPKVSNAGDVVEIQGNICQVMHNGVLIHKGCYHADWMTDIIKKLKGHHEPQEEKLFYEVLKYVGEGGTMIECGSFWSYYSLWFHSEIKNSTNIMIEPNPTKCEIGRLNFELNNFDGFFYNASIGSKNHTSSDFLDWDGQSYVIPQFTIDKIIENHNLDKVSILHMDIQGNETFALSGGENNLKKQNIDFLFIATHAPNISVIEYIKNLNYKIITSFEIRESFADDGLILACSEAVYNQIELHNFTIQKR